MIRTVWTIAALAMLAMPAIAEEPYTFSLTCSNFSGYALDADSWQPVVENLAGATLEVDITLQYRKVTATQIVWSTGIEETPRGFWTPAGIFAVSTYPSAVWTYSWGNARASILVTKVELGEKPAPTAAATYRGICVRHRLAN